MKMFRFLLITVLGSTLFLSAPGLMAQEEDPEKCGWSDLSETDQKKLREALRTVWSDPTVVSARENVNRSAHEYRRAVRETIGKQDPETAQLLEKIDRSQSGLLQSVMDSGGMRKPHHGPMTGRLSQMVAPPHMMDKMTDEQKARFKEAGVKARKKPEVMAALEQMKNLSKEDDQIRVKKMEAFRKFRLVYFESIAEIDPELKSFIPPPGPPKGKSRSKESRKGESGSN